MRGGVPSELEYVTRGFSIKVFTQGKGDLNKLTV